MTPIEAKDAIEEGIVIYNSLAKLLLKLGVCVDYFQVEDDYGVMWAYMERRQSQSENTDSTP